VVARTEAFISGHGLGEALRRAEAYSEAGADALVIHSKLSTADQVLAFMAEWQGDTPVVAIPTTYWRTPTHAFEQAGIRLVIWANHLMRASIVAMQQVAQQLYAERSIAAVEDQIAPLQEVFRLQGAAELRAAEDKYLVPRST
jgi:phosphoenolpyruvate phosphomutase